MRWLLLRGLAREQRHWGEFPRIFAERVPAASVTCLDLAGAGTEHQRVTPTSVGGLVDDLRARMLALPGDEPWSIFAVSLGGMIAMDWCARYPTDFRRCVVVNTSARDLGSFWERFVPANYPKIAATLVSADQVQRERNILDITTNNPNLDKEAIARRHAGYAAERPMTRMNVLRQILAASKQSAPERLDLPVLVVASTADRLVSSKCSTRIAERLGAELVLHDAAGHDLPTDEPAWLADQAAAWVHALDAKTG
ncbi:alpha/beta hydrolase [Myxococcota bacterium]|nr:alpha/beta hydrolase [Myxococcota bacterium]